MKSVKPKSKIKNPVIAKYVDAKEKQILEIQSMFSNMVDEIVKIKSEILNLQNQKSKTKSSKPNIENEIPKTNNAICRLCSNPYEDDDRNYVLCDRCMRLINKK